MTGIVLSAAPIGEYDKRLVILTKERGRISGFARGARRQNSSLLAAANPMVYGRFGIFEGRDSYTITSAEVGNYFPYFSTHLEDSYLAFYFLEFADRYTRENNDEQAMLELVYYTLTAVTKGRFDPQFLRRIFLWKALVVMGEAPDVFSCASCGQDTSGNSGDFVFSPSRHGIFCGNCEAPGDGIRLLAGALYTLQFITAAAMNELYGFRVPEEVAENVIRAVDGYYRLHHHHRFSSLEIWESLRQMPREEE